MSLVSNKSLPGCMGRGFDVVGCVLPRFHKTMAHRKLHAAERFSFTPSLASWNEGERNKVMRTRSIIIPPPDQHQFS